MRQYLVVVLLPGVMGVMAALPMAAQAQCSGDPCIWYTPTAPPTGTPVVSGTGTPTAVPMPSSTRFPVYNNGVPTAIPTFAFPAVPTPWQFTPIALPSPIPVATIQTPSPISISSISAPGTVVFPTVSFPTPTDYDQSITMFTPVAPAPVDFGVVGQATPLAAPSVPAFGTLAAPGALSYTAGTPIPIATIVTTIPLTYSQILTQFTTSTDTLGLEWINGLITDAVSYTNYITSGVVSSSQVITVITAPADYVPDLARPLADIGYTFEQISSPDSTQEFSVSSWAAFVGYLGSMPFKLVRMLWAIAAALGPISLAVGWIFIMFALVAGLKLIKIVVNLLLTLVDVLIRAFDVIWP